MGAGVKIYQGGKIAYKMLEGAVKGMAASAARQKVENGKISFKKILGAGVIGAATVGIGQKYDSLKKTGSLGEEVVTEGGKLVSNTIVKTTVEASVSEETTETSEAEETEE